MYKTLSPYIDDSVKERELCVQGFLGTQALVLAPAPIKAPMLVPLAPPHRQLLPVLPHQLPAHRRSMSAFTIVMLKSKLRVMFSWKVRNLQRKQSCQVNNCLLFFHLQLLLLLLLLLLILVLLSLLLPLLLLTAALAPGLTEVLGQVAAGRQEEEEEMQEGATSTFASSKVPSEKLDGGSSSRGGGLSGGRPSGRVRGGSGAAGSRQERPKKVSPPPPPVVAHQRPSQRGVAQNRSTPATMRTPPSHKTLQVGDKKVESSAARKKSVEKRLGVKESQKKPSAADKDRGSGGAVDKKDSRRVAAGGGERRSIATQERRQSKATDRSPALAKTEPNKEKNDNNDKSPIPLGKKQEKKWGGAEEKNGSLGGKSCPRPMVKHSSSVSLVRKKFERKGVESSEGGGTAPSKKHVTQPVPKGAISQNLFLKGDANAKKKAETTSLVGVEDPTKREQEGVEVEVEEEEEEKEGKEKKVEGGKEVEGGGAIPSDTETVPSQHSLVDEWGGSGCVSSWVGEPVAHLSRRQTIPNLNIDDVSPHQQLEGEEEGEQGGSRLNLDVRLEHELPESPAYRSPLLSDSEGEGDHQSSRQHVLEAYVAGSSGEETSLRNKLLSNLVNKRSESDGIVTLDRPRPEPAIR